MMWNVMQSSWPQPPNNAYPPQYPPPPPPSYGVMSWGGHVVPPPPPPPPPLRPSQYQPQQFRPSLDHFDAVQPTEPAPQPQADRFELYLQRKVEQQLCRGIFCIESYCGRQERPASDLHPVSIDIDLWNEYWEQFIDRIGDSEAAIRRVLEQEHTSDASNSRRRVVFKIAMEGDRRRTALLLRHAAYFGCVEHCMSKRKDETSLQFTTSAAAALFALDAQHGGLEVAKVLVGQHAHVFFVPSFECESTVLCLGPTLEIPSPFVEALFKGTFDAVGVDFHPSGCFHIAFQHVEQARFVHHILHASFARVFGVALTFNSNPEMQAHQPFATTLV